MIRGFIAFTAIAFVFLAGYDIQALNVSTKSKKYHSSSKAAKCRKIASVYKSEAAKVAKAGKSELAQAYKTAARWKDKEASGFKDGSKSKVILGQKKYIKAKAKILSILKGVPLTAKEVKAIAGQDRANQKNADKYDSFSRSAASVAAEMKKLNKFDRAKKLSEKSAKYKLVSNAYRVGDTATADKVLIEMKIKNPDPKAKTTGTAKAQSKYQKDAIDKYKAGKYKKYADNAAKYSRKHKSKGRTKLAAKLAAKAEKYKKLSEAYSKGDVAAIKQINAELRK